MNRCRKAHAGHCVVLSVGTTVNARMTGDRGFHLLAPGILLHTNATSRAPLRVSPVNPPCRCELNIAWIFSPGGGPMRR